ncbi:MAG: DUF1722 domain-containing protein [Desulfobacteraceae bacterium]|nr:MAG: DUF1722 domain-containing protein [Desulfobacteraceae bacterium]
MNTKPLIGISACLLGQNVRYDGGHKLDHYLRDLLGNHVEFVPVCPETECGLPVPREAMRLVEADGDIRLMTQKTKIDRTAQMKKWMEPKLRELSGLPLCGFIFKAKSPSSGWMRVKVYGKDGVRHNGTGLFAAGFTDRFPLLPVEDEGRLHDPGLRENFIVRVFSVHRWRFLNQKPKSLRNLVEFHAMHKYLLMAHSPGAQRQLGAMLGRGKSYSLPELYAVYFDSFIQALQKLATVKKTANVLMHLMGYFKKELDSAEKTEFKELIENYHAGLVPLIVPLTLLNHYVRKYKPEYLENQIYLNPHPRELMLRNHV